MSQARYAEGLSILPIIAPVAFTNAVVASAPIDMQTNQWATIIVQFGVMTSDSTDTVTVTLEAMTEATTASTSTETAGAFTYRLSDAVATDAMGAITAAVAAGAAAINATDDAKCLVVDLDPSALAAVVSGGRWFRLVFTPVTEMATGVISAVALLRPRYPQNVNLSST